MNLRADGAALFGDGIEQNKTAARRPPFFIA
jgi:hypothetical protein